MDEESGQNIMDDVDVKSLDEPEISPDEVAVIRRTIDRDKLYLKIPRTLNNAYRAFRHRDLVRYIHLGTPPLFFFVVGLILLNTYLYRDLLNGDSWWLWLLGSSFVTLCVALASVTTWNEWGRRHYSALVSVAATLVLAKLATFPSLFGPSQLGVVESYFCGLAVIVVVLALRLPLGHIVMVLLATTGLVFGGDQLISSYQLNVLNFIYYFLFVAAVCLFIAWQLEEKEKLEFLQWLLIGYNRRVNEQLQNELKAQALRDSLTQIANRRAFEKALENEWERLKRQRQPLSLLFMDIDYFKPYNDTYGHDAGDQCLQQVAAGILTALNRPSDLAARIGGEEFVVLLPDTDAEGAAVIGSRIQAQLEQLAIPHAASEVSQRVTLSIGVASQVPDRESKPKGLLKAADTALYAAKAAGRNRIVRADGLPPVTP